MCNVFSNILKQRYVLINKAQNNRDFSEIKVKEAISFMSQTKSIVPQIMISGEDVDIDDDILYEYCTNEGLRTVVSWINENILFPIEKDSRVTTQVKLRIATGMLNKLNLSSSLSVWIHQNVSKNILEVGSDVLTEDLPF